MTYDVKLELVKFRVPLTQAWEESIKVLVAHPDRCLVEESTIAAASRLEKQLCGIDLPEEDAELLSRARQDALAFVQTKFSGTLPELPERESDLLSQHSSIWSLIGKLLHSSGSSSTLSEWAVSHSISLLEAGRLGSGGSQWKLRAKNVLNTLNSLKGSTDETINTLCLTETFLCERDLVIPAVKLIVRSKRFKKLMSAPDMDSDGEKTLPKLLVNVANDKEFRSAFVWLPLDPENPLNKSGGSGVMPTDKEDYRFVLAIIMKILFGKLRQRGNGIDKRSSFGERQNQIMSYIGTVPVDEMEVVFQTLLGRLVVAEKLSNFSLLQWSGSEFVDSVSQRPVLNKAFMMDNVSVLTGVLQSMAHVVAQMKRKIDAFAPLLACVVVSTLVWTEDKTTHKVCLQRLSELMAAYPHLGPDVWLQILAPAQKVLEEHILRSSSAETSIAFKIVTNWAHHESLVSLYSTDFGHHLLASLFTPRSLSGTPATALFSMVLSLCGFDETDGKSASYSQSRRELWREHKRTGGEDSDTETDDVTISSGGQQMGNETVAVVVQHVEAILETLALSMAAAKDKSLILQVTATLAQLAASHNISLPSASTSALLTLMGDQLKSISGLTGKKARAVTGIACKLFDAVSALSKLVSADLIPPTLLGTVAKSVTTLDDIKGRVLMSECILELTKKVAPADVAAAEILCGLNAVRSAASLQPDVDKHVDVLQDLLDSPDDAERLKLVSSIVLVRHCLFLIASVACDSTVRHCAERFIAEIGSVRDEKNRLPVPTLLMVLGHLHRVLDAHSSEVTHRSALKLVVVFVRDFASKIDPETDAESFRLLHGDLLQFAVSKNDGGTAVLDDLTHIQKHRRSRALAKLVDACDSLSEYTKEKLIVPLAIEGIVQPGVAKSNYDMFLSDTGMRAVRSAPHPVDLLVRLVKQFLRKFEEREKVIFKTIGNVTAFLRESGGLSDSDRVRVESVLVPNLRKRVFDKKGSLKSSTLIGDQSEKHRLARDKNADPNDGLVKIEAVVALLEVIQLLPKSAFNENLGQLVRIILQGLPSRELINRRAAREALRKVAKTMGIERTPWLLREVRHALPRGGYQAAVAVFTCFSIIESLVDKDGNDKQASHWPKLSSDIAFEVLELLKIEDRQWAALQSRADRAIDQETEIANQCVEAKRHKAHELLTLASKWLYPSVVTGVVLKNVYGLLNTVGGYHEHDVSDDDVVDDVQLSGNDSDSSSEDESKEKKRKRAAPVTKLSRKSEIQLNAVQGKKFFTRIEAALNAVLQGIADNAQYLHTQRMALCVQSLAHFEDISSRKFRFDESMLFARNAVADDLLRVDEAEEEKPVKKQKVNDLRQRQKEKTFMVQPGASTGRGHWVTEEWKKGKLAGSSEKAKQIGSIDLAAVKAKVLGLMGLKLFMAVLTGADSARWSQIELVSPSAAEEDRASVVKAVGKFVTRAFCSGIAELFQLSAKAIQRLLVVGSEAEVFNAKAMNMIARKLISSMEQLHHSGSDLSFIVLKQQRKTPQAELATTCAALLLSLVDRSDEWMKPDMLETLAAHVRASMDKPALQLAALAILRKLVSRKQFKSATLYDCFKTVGDLLVAATNPRVCGLCGVLYAQFLVDFAHTEKALMQKVLALLKQAQSASSAVSRCTALNTLHAFVRALPCKALQDVYGEIIFVTLAVNVSAEDDQQAKQMYHQIFTATLRRFTDATKRDRLVAVVANWPQSMTKHQFVFGSVEVSTVLAKDQLLAPATAVDVLLSVIRQLPHLIAPESSDQALLTTQGLLTIVAGASRVLTESPVVGTEKLVQFLFHHLLMTDSVAVPVVVEVLRLVNTVSAMSPALFTDAADIDSTVADDKATESVEPWPVLMRVLWVLTRGTTESHLEVASVAMKTIAGLLPLCSATPRLPTAEEGESTVTAEVDESDDEIEVSTKDLGLFAATALQGTKRESESIQVIETKSADASERLAALLKKIRYEVRGLMANPRESVIRLASLIKLAAALTLSADPAENDEILGTSLEILIRLATINRSAEEVSTEVQEVNSLFELSTLRPIEQVGCLSKMANGAIESLEKHFKSFPAFFTKQLTTVTALVNKTRKDRKISLLNLAVSNPARLAMLRLNKSKRKTEKKQIRGKESVKRIKGLIH